MAEVQEVHARGARLQYLNYGIMCIAELINISLFIERGSCLIKALLWVTCMHNTINIIYFTADYQMREIVKYVPESMRIPSSNLKLQDAVGQGNY